MFRFENPIFLYLLVLIPVLALIRFIAYQRQRKRLKAFGELKLIKALMPDVSRFRPWVKYLLSLAAWHAGRHAGKTANGDKSIRRETQWHRDYDSHRYQQFHAC